MCGTFKCKGLGEIHNMQHSTAFIFTLMKKKEKIIKIDLSLNLEVQWTCKFKDGSK